MRDKILAAVPYMTEDNLDEVMSYLLDPRRYLHSYRRHIVPMLERVFELNITAINLQKLILTILYHDVIYIPGRKDNELHSHDFFSRHSRNWPQIPKSVDTDVKYYILLTQNHQRNHDELWNLFMKMDFGDLAVPYREGLAAKGENSFYEEFTAFNPQYKRGEEKYKLLKDGRLNWLREAAEKIRFINPLYVKGAEKWWDAWGNG